jgi:hypothetical protein
MVRDSHTDIPSHAPDTPIACTRSVPLVVYVRAHMCFVSKLLMRLHTHSAWEMLRAGEGYLLEQIRKFTYIEAEGRYGILGFVCRARRKRGRSRSLASCCIR